MDFDGIAQSIYSMGRASAAWSRLAAFQEAGATHFIFKHAGPADEEMDQMALLRKR